MASLPCFKAYDIRGRVPDQLNEDLAWRIGFATATHLQAQQLVVGRDIRLSSEPLAAALSAGINAAGCDVLDIGLCGTEEVYFATANQPVDGGIMVTASHNPIDYNGMKLVRSGARPISGDSGLHAIGDLVQQLASAPSAVTQGGQITPIEARPAYIAHLLSYLDQPALQPLRLVVNPGNGGAGLVLDQLAPHLPQLELIKVHYPPDGHFPNGIPNPLLPERRAATADAVRAHGADLGIAWDGDFDRCFLFDEQGRFIEGYYIVGLLASAFLQHHPGEKIVHDPRLTWNTIEQVQMAGGIAVQSKTGHAFIKERMRAENAIYGGEMSAHHYFRDFAYCDSGMIPWLLLIDHLSREQRPLSALVNDRMAAFPCSGEINFTVTDSAATTARILEHYRPAPEQIDHTDGVSVEFSDWRFNVRSSNTEPVLRLNVESRGDAALMAARRDEIAALIVAE